MDKYILILTTNMLRTRYLIFDVETTGLLPREKKNGPAIPITDYPYILQLSFAIYDSVEKSIIQKYDSYVRIPDEVEISSVVQSITGINKEVIQKKGKPIEEVLEKFYEAYVFCHGLVAHNM